MNGRLSGCNSNSFNINHASIMAANLNAASNSCNIENQHPNKFQMMRNLNGVFSCEDVDANTPSPEKTSSISQLQTLPTTN